MTTVTVHEGSQKLLYEAKNDERLIDFLSINGYTVSAPCGGCKRCGKCTVKATGALSEMQEDERQLLTSANIASGVRLACFATIQGDCEIFIENTDSCAIQTGFYGNVTHSTQKSGYGLAIDIGTTTVVVYLYDLRTGQRIAVSADKNAQASFGADVISRINAAADKGNLKALNNTIVLQLNSLIAQAAQSGHISLDDISSCIIAANTTMLHFLCEFDPAGLAAAPFVGESLFGIQYRSGQLGLNFNADVYLIPCVSAYVGGDITSGMAAVGLENKNGVTLYLDLGTNGEIALCAQGEILCCSAAAGPVFEGAHIKYGMPGIAGAINKVTLLDDNTLKIETVANAAPKGICGSGLIDAIAVMLKTGVIDESGYMEEDFVLCNDPYIAVTPSDVREIQLAKSAICSGVTRLCAEKELTQKDIDEVILAGGFGSNIDPVSAGVVGLFDCALTDRCSFAGNTAGMGAAMCLINDDVRDSIETLPDKCRYIELSGDKLFNELYIENMMFNI